MAKKVKNWRQYLTNVNFSNLGYQLKCIETLKHYQQSLAQPASTIKSEEKSAVKKVTRQLICQYDYFSQVGQKLSKTNQEKILDMVAAGKGVTLYEKITTCNSLDSELENKFLFEINEFYSELKQSNGSEIEHENSKFLYQTLKMRDLYDMNDLYNFQDMCSLCEIIENKFETMHKRYGFNLRRCNSASTWSGFLERDLSKVITALRISNDVVKMFEKSLTSGFSCINTRLGFDTEILTPNHFQDNFDEFYKSY